MGKRTFIILVFFCINFAFGKDLPVQNIKDIAIYWDASLSQKDKKIEKEFEFLDTYFKIHTDLKIKLIVFNTSIIVKETVEIKSSNWIGLKEKLKHVTYDGASDFSLVNTELSDDMILFFTDGNGNLGNFEASLYSPRIITISSKTDIDKKFLHKTAFYNRGYYVNLLESDISSSIKAIDNEVIMPKLEFVTQKNIDDGKNYVRGIVIGKTDGLSNVNITINDQNRGTITDQNGNYKIAAEPGDVLVFSSVDMKSAVVEVGEEEIINVQLTDLVNELGPAIVKSRKEEKPDLINTGNQLVDKKTLGYAVQSIDSDDIGNDRNTLGRAVAGKFSGVTMGEVDNAGLIMMRGMNSMFFNSNFALLVVNGIPLPQSEKFNIENYSFINPDDIADITVLKSYAATNRFGAQGRNGVILITTKNAVSNFTDPENTEADKKIEIEYKPYPSSLKMPQESDPYFISILKKTAAPEKAYSKYLALLETNKDNISFFLECSEYFFNKNMTDKGIRVLSNLAELYPQDTSVLKILAFHLEKQKLFDESELIYKRIITVSPSLSQGYLDLANLYTSKEKHKESIDLFKKITANKVEEIESFDGLNNQITNDFRALLKKRNQSWKTNNIDQKYFICPTYPVRVVAEWSHPETEFDFRYINSKKQYFSVTHNLEDNKGRMRKEIKEGFTSDEYILSDIEPGRWYLDVVLPDGYKVDVKYPKVLKIKVFTKFGAPDQKLQTHVVNLDKISKNKIVTSFTIQ